MLDFKKPSSMDAIFVLVVVSLFQTVASQAYYPGYTIPYNQYGSNTNSDANLLLQQALYQYQVQQKQILYLQQLLQYQQQQQIYGGTTGTGTIITGTPIGTGTTGTLNNGLLYGNTGGVDV